VEEALSSGALGYVHKPRAGNDLFPAVAAVLEGKQFVSDGLLAAKRNLAARPVSTLPLQLQLD